MQNRYQIIRLIIKDQLGGVYLAKDTELDREIVFRNFDTGNGEISLSDWAKSYSLFASKLKDLQHPSLIPIHDALIEDEHPILVSEFIEADTIAEHLQKRSLGAQETIDMAVHLLSALQAAHNAGIYHGAIHTGSIKRLPSEQGGPRYLIIDLGLKHLSCIVTGEEAHPEDPILIAPELHDQTSTATAQSDIFTIGQLCYTVLAGGHPFTKHSAEKCAKLYKANKMPPLSQFAANIPPALSNWIRSLTNGSAAQRPASAAEALKSLQAIALSSPDKKDQPSPSSQPIPSTPSKKSKWGLVLGVLSLLAICIGLFLTFTPKGPENHTAEQPEPQPAPRPEPEAITPVTLTKPAKNHTSPDKKRFEKILAQKITPQQSMETIKIVSIDSSQYFDWAIIPVKKNSNPYQSKSLYQLLITHEPPENPTPLDKDLINFTIKEKGKFHTLFPIQAHIISSTSSQTQKWEVSFKAPAAHQGPLEAHFYITQQDCELSFGITFPDQKRILVDSRSKGPGVIEAKLFFPQIKPNQLYRIQVTATPNHQKKTYTTGLHGVFLFNPPTQNQLVDKVSQKHKKAAKKKQTQKSPGFIPPLQTFTPENHFHSEKWFHAEGSILKINDNEYCLVYSRWLKSKTLSARITHPEIAIATSHSPTGPWKHQKTILKGRKNHWDKIGVSHPILKKFKDKYYLYYVSTSADITIKQLEAAAKMGGGNKIWKTLNNNRCIGVAQASSYEGPWKRMSAPILKASPPFSGFSCSPSVTQSPDGQYLIMVCSTKAKKTVSYITKSALPYFSNPTTLTTVPGEYFSLWYDQSDKTYHFIDNGDNKNFFFLNAPEKLNKPQRREFPKPAQLPPDNPIKTKSIKSPNVFTSEDGTPEVFIFHSEDPKNGGIFTIPFKK